MLNADTDIQYAAAFRRILEGYPWYTTYIPLIYPWFTADPVRSLHFVWARILYIISHTTLYKNLYIKYVIQVQVVLLRTPSYTPHIPLSSLEVSSWNARQHLFDICCCGDSRWNQLNHCARYYIFDQISDLTFCRHFRRLIQLFKNKLFCTDMNYRSEAHLWRREVEPGHLQESRHKQGHVHQHAHKVSNPLISHPAQDNVQPL